MQGFTTLIEANIHLIQQISRNRPSSSLTLPLENIRKLLNEISKLNFLENKYLDSQCAQDEEFSQLDSDKAQKFIQSLIRVISSKEEQIFSHPQRVSSEEDHDDAPSKINIIVQLYQSLVDQIKSRWILEGRQKLRYVWEVEQLEEIYNDMGIEEFKKTLRELQNQLNYMITDKNEKQIDTDSKSKKKSMEQAQHGDFHEKSSVRSLLTEKLKNLQPINIEDDVSCIDGKILVKTNWIMKQMKQNSRGNATEPIKNISSNASQGSLSENVYSVGFYNANLIKGSSKNRFQAQRAILKEINVDMPQSKEKKTKKEKTGCAQCDIY